MNIVKTLIISVILIASMQAVSHAAIIIDEFTDPSYIYLLPAYGVTETRTDGGLSQVIGGTRKIEYTRYQPGLEGMYEGIDYGDSFVLATWQGMGFAALNCGCFAWGIVTFDYDANGLGLNADFSDSQNIIVNFWADHLGWVKPSIMSFTLADVYGNTYTETKIWPTRVEVLGWRTELFSLSDYSAQGVDLSHIDFMRFYYEGDDANDIAFDNILLDGSTIIPEPSSAILLLSSRLLFTALRKRLKTVI